MTGLPNRLAIGALLVATILPLGMTACATSEQQTLGRVERSPGGGTTIWISEADQARIALLRAQADGAFDAEEWAKAEVLLKQVMALDWDELRSIHTRQTLAEVYEAQGRYPEAITAYRLVLQQSEEAWGGEDGSPRIAERLNLGRALASAGRVREAERYYDEALVFSVEALRDYTPGHHSEVIDGPQVSTFAILAHLDQLLTNAGRGREMQQRWREILPLFVAAVGEDNSYTQAIRTRLGTLESAGI